MAEPENSRIWFITHEGERTGPYSMEELKAKAELHELHPRFDMVWKEGMGDWIPAGEAEGLFQKNTDATPDPKHHDSKHNASGFSLINEQEATEQHEEQREWEGVSRGGYFFFVCIFPIIWFGGLFFGTEVLKDLLDDSILTIVLGVLSILPFFISIFATIQRFQNLAMSRAWFFGLFLPIINFWLYYRLFACPPGYAEHKKLGFLGWLLAFIYWTPFVLVVALLGFIAKQPDKFNEVIEKNRPLLEEYMTKVEEMTETPDEAKEREEKEKAEKGPSIIPIK